MDSYPPSKQRAALEKLAEALGSRPSALRPDECADPRIEGGRGHIYAVPGVLGDRTPGFMLYVIGWEGRGWGNAKRAMSFAALVNDGDEEGAVFLARLPDAGEADVIRHYLGVPKKVELSAAELERRRAQAATFNVARNAA